MSIRLVGGVQPIGFQEERERLMETYHRDIAPIYRSFCGDDGQFRGTDYELFQAMTASQLRSLERQIASLKEKYENTA